MNSDFNIIDMDIDGVRLIEPFFVEDKRGYFLKTYEKDVFAGWGIEGEAYEDFETFSVKNVIRGMHFQLEEPQQKIVHVVSGSIIDVVVDLRKDSPTYGKHISVELSAENHRVLYIPKGFAHGFEVISDHAVTAYRCIGRYLKGSDTGVRWNSPGLGIEWKTKEPIMTDRDASLMDFAEFTEKYGGL